MSRVMFAARTVLAAAGATLALSAPAPALADGQRCAAEAAIYSVRGVEPTVVTFHNSSRMIIRIYWIDYEGRRVHFSTLRPGQSYSANTFASHPWIVTNQVEDCQQVVYAERDMTFTYR